MPNKLRKAPGKKKKPNGACWVNQHVLWIKYRSPSVPLFNISPRLSISALHLTNLLSCSLCILILVYVVSRCSATTTSCIWSQWARPTQASMSARPSCPGLEWERPRLHSLSTVSYYPITLPLITLLILAKNDKTCRTVLPTHSKDLLLCQTWKMNYKTARTSMLCLFQSSIILRIMHVSVSLWQLKPLNVRSGVLHGPCISVDPAWFIPAQAWPKPNG